ncbi:hypothetical protein [Desertimonas flava]|uniref:hypothetical protein n=1 Tax=Desertimonas flava TaxID=2064846 RepID=UPI001968C62B|nr:hypothetical protein [Desertimonas flava]
MTTPITPTTPSPSPTAFGSDTQPTAPVVAIRRRTVDTVLIALGAVAAVVFGVAGGLLTWGANFADDYVGRELGAQQVFFPDEAALVDEGREDLVKFAGEQVTTGDEAEAYASYIDGHLQGIADGATYAELGAVQGEARAAVTAATEEGASEDEIAELQATVDEITSQRDTLFRGETLRGLLLSTYAWSTIGTIAGIAAIVAFVAAGLMAVLVVAGLVHLRRAHRPTS